MENQFLFFDVVYKTPTGVIGTHVAVKAENLQRALDKSLLDLSIGSPWEPEDFTLISACPSATPPLESEI